MKKTLKLHFRGPCRRKKARFWPRKYKSEVVAKFATTTRHGAIEGKTQTHLTEYYNLDMIISVGYRVKSLRGVEFRRWANYVLKQYVMQGYAVNQKRLSDLGNVFKLLRRTEESLDTKQILTVVERYSTALNIIHMIIRH